MSWEIHLKRPDEENRQSFTILILAASILITGFKSRKWVCRLSEKLKAKGAYRYVQELFPAPQRWVLGTLGLISETLSRKH